MVSWAAEYCHLAKKFSALKKHKNRHLAQKPAIGYYTATTETGFWSWQKVLAIRDILRKFVTY